MWRIFWAVLAVINALNMVTQFHAGHIVLGAVAFAGLGVSLYCLANE